MPQLSIEKWVHCSIATLYYYASPPATSSTLGSSPQAKNSIRNTPANAALTHVSYQSHNAHTAIITYMVREKEMGYKGKFW